MPYLPEHETSHKEMRFTVKRIFSCPFRTCFPRLHGMLLCDPELQLVHILICGIELTAFESAVLELHKYMFATLILSVGHFRKCRAVPILAGYKHIGYQLLSLKDYYFLSPLDEKFSTDFSTDLFAFVKCCQLVNSINYSLLIDLEKRHPEKKSFLLYGPFSYIKLYKKH